MGIICARLRTFCRSYRDPCKMRDKKDRLHHCDGDTHYRRADNVTCHGAHCRFCGQHPSISPKTWLFLVLSGLATGASWLCYYKALRDGLASVVVPIDKLSILITIAFSYIFFGERLPKCRYGGGFVISFIDELNFAFDHPRLEFVRSFSLCASSKADTVKSKPPQKSSRRFQHKKEHR